MDFAEVIEEKTAIFIARRKKRNFAAVNMEKPSHVCSKKEKANFTAVGKNPVMCMAEDKSGFYNNC